MIIDMKTKAAGPNGVLLPAHRYNVPDEQGQPLVDGGYATLFQATPEPIGADVDPDDIPVDSLIPAEDPPADSDDTPVDTADPDEIQVELPSVAAEPDTQPLTPEQLEDVTIPRGRRSSQ